MSKKILIINTGGTLSAVLKRNGLIPGLSIYDMQKELKMVSMEACDMTSEAALTKLMWILGMTDDISEIRDYYSINIAGERQ